MVDRKLPNVRSKFCRCQRRPLHAAKEVVDLTDLNTPTAATDWAPDGETNRVRLHWLINNAIRRRSTGTWLLCEHLRILVQLTVSLVNTDPSPAFR